ncbi:MAG: hypothetical protein OES12_10495, partial [Anaerolineae bacterium]|nr:hypothetical protein [Anaerolineae bacterium]
DFDQIEQEEIWVLLMNSRHKVTYEVMVYRGQVDEVSIRPAEVFREAVRTNASGIIVSHNHPSGDATASLDDVNITEKLCQAGKLLGITIHDHLIIGKKAWVSLRERGLMN